MAPASSTGNTLYYGDNLDILRNREYFPTASVDLIYLDPPFNSNRNYNVLFKDESGVDSQAQITAFTDTWHWNQAAESTYHELVTEGSDRVSKMVGALRDFVGTNQMMAYLVMMAARLVELHRVLKPTGSLYLHCDPTASHYLKIILDTIFDPRNFVNEIVWRRAGTVKGNYGQGSKMFGSNTDSIFFYRKSENNTFNAIFSDNSEEYLKQYYRYVEPETGRRYRLTSMIGPGGAAKGNPKYEVMGVTRYWRYSKQRMQEMIDAGLVVQTKPGAVPSRKLFLEDVKGKGVQTLWDDIEALGATAAERLGYPTQKPLALMERIILASSNPGDIVLDPFAGCGTTVAAAQKLGRRWIGIDITHLSIALLKYRLVAMFPGIKFKVVGEPEDLGAAHQLAQDDRYQFQWWALSLVHAKPLGGEEGSREGKKGADKGVDGVINFVDDSSGKPKRVIIQVKSGNVNRGLIAALKGDVEREKAAIGVFITLDEPTAPMISEAVSAGYYSSPDYYGTGEGKKYPRIQILTIEQLMSGTQVQMPPPSGTFRQAQQVKQSEGEQLAFDVE